MLCASTGDDEREPGGDPGASAEPPRPPATPDPEDADEGKPPDDPSPAQVV